MSGLKFKRYHIGYIWGAVWGVQILIKKITEVLSNPRDEFIKPN